MTNGLTEEHSDPLIYVELSIALVTLTHVVRFEVKHSTMQHGRGCLNLASSQAVFKGYGVDHPKAQIKICQDELSLHETYCDFMIDH